jgi:V/A-type H+-transporting ATPase subunit K
MGTLMEKAIVNPGETFALGVFAGLGIGVAAVTQGIAAAGGADAMGETGKGFANYLMICGIGETVALFTMVFTIM